MPRLGDKYIAGFLDADGSIGIGFNRETRRPQLSVSFSQNVSQDEVVHRIHEELRCGSICERTSNAETRYSTLTLTGSDARMLLNRIGHYLVVKRHFAAVAVDVSQRSIDPGEIETVKAYLKVHRFMPSLPVPPHPSRSWMAGYLDGDGCFSITKVSKFGEVKDLVLHVAADKRKVEGLELIQKNFGGRIYPMSQDRCRQLVIRLDPPKVLSMCPDLAKRMVVKADQVYFLLGCAQMGHFRDGSNIKAALKSLKARPHRLNEPRTDVHELLRTVRDLPKAKRTDYGEFTRDWHGRINGKKSFVQATVDPAT